MKNRSANAHSGSPSLVDAATADLRNAHISPPHPVLRAAQSAPGLPTPFSAPRPGGPGPLGGIAARRRPNSDLKLSHIIGAPPGGGGTSGAGLGAGRPQGNDDTPVRRPNFTGTPFSNFDKIVYALISCSLSLVRIYLA